MKTYFETKFKETEIGNIPVDWEVRDIGEVSSYGNNMTKYDKSLKYISTENMTPQDGNIDFSKRVSIPERAKYFEEQDVLFSNIRTYFKKVYISKIKGFCSNDILQFKINKNKIYPKLFFYNLFSNEFIEYTVKSSNGAKMPRGDKKAILQYKIPLPPTLTEQKNIAKILSDLDEKIEINNKINENLEQIGKAIFKRWFVDFEFENKNGKNYKSNNGKMVFCEELEKKVPEGWEVGKIGDIVKEISEKIGNEKNINVMSAVNTGELIRSQDYFKKQVFSKELNKYKKIKKLDFAYNPARVNIGSIGMLKNFKSGAISPVYIGFSVRKNYHWFFEKFLKSNKTKTQIKVLCSGGVRQVLDFKGFKKLYFLIPNEKIILNFNKFYEKNLEVIKNNELENQKLQNLRDYLLPKLMRGEIRIKQ